MLTFILLLVGFTSVETQNTDCKSIKQYPWCHILQLSAVKLKDFLSILPCVSNKLTGKKSYVFIIF
jgi:hypothetical protein